MLALILGLVLSGLPAYAGTAGNYPGHQAVAGDFNGDGWTDLLLQPLAGEQNVAELVAYSSGNFGPPLDVWRNNAGGTDWNSQAHRLVVGDFNGDGRDDVLLQGAAGRGSRIAFARPDGSVKQTDVTVPNPLDGLDLSQAEHHLVVGDFNGDGRDDILLQANAFTGTNAIALSDASGNFDTIASRWGDGYHGLSWSLDRAAIAAGDFAGTGRDELLVRSDSLTASGRCCELITLGKSYKPDRIAQHWSGDYLGVDWNPSTHLAIVGDFNGDGRADVLLQPQAVGSELAVVLADSAGHLSSVSERWASERDGIDWSAQSYKLVLENAAPGQGATLLMVPKQVGLPYRRASFDASGHLVAVTTVQSQKPGILAGDGDGTGSDAGATTPGGPRTLATNTSGNADTPGTMNGQVSVANGVAGYSIKIAVPPGRSGMQPSLSLGYSSSGGDGHEGVGWSLGGFSSIYRCPATWATDGYTAGTDFSYNDRFCLDGAKLLLTSGTYGADGSVYHTEVNGYSKIVAHGSQGNGPAYFTVRTPDGNLAYYGSTDESRLLDNAPDDLRTAFSWSISKTVDLRGNQVVYHYTNIPPIGESFPSEIDYTLGNGSAGAMRKVKFTWEQRSVEGAGNLIHYLAGMTQSTTRLLIGVTTWVGDAEVRDYRLSYQQSAATGRPLLDSVQACAYLSGDEHCFNPTTFTYQAQSAPQFAPVDATAGLNLSLYDANGCNVSDNANYLGAYDRNGDGKTDLVYSERDQPLEIKFWEQDGSPTGFSSRQPANGIMYSHQPIDFNLDGRTDGVSSAVNGGTSPKPIDVAYVTPAGNVATKETGAVAPSVYSSQDPYPSFQDPLVGDFNGDGRPDLAVFSEHVKDEYKLQVYLAHGIGDATHYQLASGFTMQSSRRINFARVMDDDADGRSDILVRYGDDANFTLLHSEGDHFASITTTVDFVANPNTGQSTKTYTGVPLFFADINGDSLPDIVESMNPGGAGWDWYIYPNKGNNSFGAPVDSGISVPVVGDPYYGINYKLNDFVRPVHDPDGGTDLLIPRARSFYSPNLVADCGEQGRDGQHCGIAVTVGSCTGYDTRTDYAPQGRDGYDWKLYRTDGGSFTLTATGQQIKNAGPAPAIDFNNDGLPDYLGISVTVSSGSVLRRYKAYKLTFGGAANGANPSPMPDLMMSVKNGLGVVDSINYQPISNSASPSGNPIYTRTALDEPQYPHMRFASPMQVVASLEESNPVGGTNTEKYHYEDGQYNVAGRGFEGFRVISDEDVAHGLETTTTYEQAFPLTGHVKSSQTVDLADGQSTPFATTNHQWSSYPPEPGTVPAPGTGYQVFDAKTSTRQTDPKSNFALISQTTVTRSGIDACGHLGDIRESTSTQEATGTKDTTNTYANANEDNCWQDTLDQSHVVTTNDYPGVAGNATPAVSDGLDVVTTYHYDSLYELIRKDVTASRGGDSRTRRWTYGYDVYGNREMTTRINLQQDTPSGNSRTTTTSYGSIDGFDAHGYFPVSVTNDLGQTATAVYDRATGNKTETWDPNGVWTRYAYDAFGRKLGKSSKDESPVVGHFLYSDASNVNCGVTGDNTPSYALEETQDGYPTSFTCFDAYGDKLRTATQAPGGSSWAVVDMGYDRFGRKVKQTTPYYPGESPSTTTTQYDVLDRAIETDSPTRKVDIAYHGLILAYRDIDETGMASNPEHDYTRYYDGFGKGNGHLVRVDQQAGDGTYTATYRYDAGGDLVRAIDAAGHAITASYDGFGDKLALHDPDKGDSSYTYDGFGEEVTETDATGHVITTHYDKLGRAVEVDDPADQRVTKTVYDTAPYGIGKPALETVSENGSVTYTRRYGYDDAGRLQDTLISTGGRSYVQGVTFDDKGRPSEQVYPALGGGASTSGPAVNPSVSPAGPVNLGTRVTLHANASDPNGDWSLGYQWQQTGGPGAALSDPTAETPTVTLSAAGTYTFKVTVNDGFKTRAASVSIEAEAPPSATEIPGASPNPSYTGAFTVSWGSLGGADSYKLQESSDGGSSWNTIYTGSALSKAVSGKSVGSYAYRVQGCNPVGCGRYGGAFTETVEVPTGTVTPTASPSPSLDGTFTVSWGAVPDANRYRLEESANGDAWTPVQNSGSRSWTASGKSAGTYRYRVRACSAVGCGTPGGTLSESVDPPPSGGRVSFNPNPSYTGSYTVSWAAITRATSYRLQELAPGGNWTTVYTGSGRSKSFSGRGVGAYRYRVRGCDSVGCGGWGIASGESVSAPPAPGTPALGPNPSHDGAYTVSWSAEAGASSYQLQQQVGSGNWSTVQNAGSRSWSTSGEADGTYQYRVRTCNTVTGCGGWSGTATETVAWVPATPTGLHHVTPPLGISPGSNFTLAWDAAAHATSYQLAMNGTTAPQTGITATSASVTAPSRGDTTFTMRVRACGAGGCSAWSAPISLTTTASTGGGGGGIQPRLATAPAQAAADGGTGALVVATGYDAVGYPVTLSRASDGYTYLHIQTIDARGNATLVYEGGTDAGSATVVVTRGYDPVTGSLVSVDASNPQTNAELAHVTATWDGFGNLHTRSAGGSIETAAYDRLNRLKHSSIALAGGGGTSQFDYAYDKTGNRTQACSDTGCRYFDYGTHGSGPHALSAVNAVSSDYAYNANGEMTRDQDRTLGWAAFGKVASIGKGGTTLNFSYGPGNARYKKVVTGPGSETVTYLGAAERLDVGGDLSIRRTLGMAGLTVIDTGGAHAGVHFAIPDHLGSEMALIDSSGSLTESLSYGDFGKRYAGGWASLLSNPQAWTINTTLTDKGYTGQESLDSVGLDDYNARLYDPGLGRFLSVDPMIGHPGSTQSINPYSYVENNPLNKVDPTGQTDAETGGCNGGDNQSCTLGQISTGDMKKTVINSDGSVSVTLNSGKVLSSKAGAVSTGTMKEIAAGVASTLAGNNINVDALDKAVTGGDPNRTSKHSFSLSDMHKGLVAACVYKPQCSGVGYISRKKTYGDKKSGFKAGLFKNGRTGNYIGAFAGVDGFGAVNDWWGSFRQMIGLRSKQFDEAVALAKKWSVRLGSSLSFTGHSLGGGLATLAALVTRRHATIFNSEWLSNGTLERNHLPAAAAAAMASKWITAYHTGQDPLTLIQHFWPGLNELGRQEELGDGGHGIGSVLGAF